MSSGASRRQPPPSGLVLSLERHVLAGFASQAEAHGKRIHRRLVASRERDPMIATMLDTFTRQRKDYAARAEIAHKAGDMLAARELGESAMRADANLKKIRDAIEN